VKAVTPPSGLASRPHGNVRIRSAPSRPRRITVLRAGAGSGYRFLIDRSRVRVPPGASALR